MRDFSAGAAVGITLMAAVFLAIRITAVPTITHAVGVISRCGVYAVATIDSSGAVEVYDSEREARAERPAELEDFPLVDDLSPA